MPSNLPPGCSDSDIPGVVETEAEHYGTRIHDTLDKIFDSDEDTMNIAVEYVFEIVEEARGTAYQEGVTETAMAEEVRFDQLASAVRDLLKEYNEEWGAISVEPDPGCRECTSDTTPDSHNTGPCPLHRILKLIGESK